MLKVEHLHVSIGDYTIIEDITFELKPSQWLMVIGPNGAGKSTLVNAISQGVSYEGTIFCGNKDMSTLRAQDVAHKIGVLMQHHFVGYSFTVEEIVQLGRYAHSKGIFSSHSEEDHAMVEKALEQTGLLPFRHQSVLTLSGGELQRTFLAQLLAQNPSILMLDEPANHLDLVYQKQVFDMIESWVHNKRAVLSVVHDLNLAKAYGTHALLINKGNMVAFGEVDKVLSRKNLEDVYKMDVYEWMHEMGTQWQ